MTTHNPTNHLAARADRAALLVIMLAAALLRARYLLQIEYNVDHAWPIAQALETLDRGILPLVGQGTSVLFANPALTGYLYLPVVALTRSPLGVYVLVIALNTLAVFLAYRTARLVLGTRQALIAAGLMAVNPWMIEYSRMAWVQSLLPFFACAITWLLWPVLLGRSRRPTRRTVLALIMLTLASQTYLLAFAFVLPVGVLLVIFRRRVPRRGLLVGVTIFVLAALLYGAGLLGQWSSVQADVRSFSSNPASFHREALDHAVRLVSGADYELVRGTLAPQADAALRHDLSRIAHGAVVIGLLGGIALAIRAIWLGKRDAFRRDAAAIILIWFLLPILMMIYVGQAVHPFYQLLGVPAGYVLAGWGFGAILRPEKRWGAVLLVALAVPFTLLMSINSARYYQETAAIPGAHGLSALPLQYGLPLGATAREAGIGFIDLEGWVLNSLAGRWFPTMREVRAPAFTLIPHEGGVYIQAHPPGSTVGEPPIGAQRDRKFDLPDGWTITVDVFPPDATTLCAVGEGIPGGTGAQQVDIPSEQGLILRTYTLEQGDADAWTLTAVWQVAFRTDTTDHRLYGAFAHVFDATGSRVLIVDGAQVPGYEWREGDCHVHRLTFTLPSDAPEPFTVSLGQYDPLNQENVIFILPDGTYTSLIPLEPALTRTAGD